MNRQDEIEQHEIDLLLEALHRVRGHDFRQYARASLTRRINLQMQRSGCTHISELIPLMLYDDNAFENFLNDMSVTVTDMFRDPLFFKALRQQVIPRLKTWPFIKVWCAGCATGEEIYSLAIILMEEGLYNHTRIYATDYNKKSLNIAKDGVYPLAKLKHYIANYNASGGTQGLGDYYHARYEHAKMAGDLKKNILFSHHNLVTDAVFGEMNLILCRNVLIYFNQTLQNRVLTLFKDSLCTGGFLCLGTKESLGVSSVEQYFEPQDKQFKIFRKKYQTEPTLSST